MKYVSRTNAPPPLTRWAERWTQEIKDALERYQSGAGPAPAPLLWNKYRKNYVQEALYTMFHGKCAYCESKIGHIDYLHIEHYRPKSKYPELTFQWENFLAACTKCNTNKGDTFPLDEAESPLLIDPCIDNPAQHMWFINARACTVDSSRTGYMRCHQTES